MSDIGDQIGSAPGDEPLRSGLDRLGSPSGGEIQEIPGGQTDLASAVGIGDQIDIPRPVLEDEAFQDPGFRIG